MYVYYVQLEALCVEKSAQSRSRGSSIQTDFIYKGKRFSMSPFCLKEMMLESLVGTGRRMDLLLGLPALCKVLKTKEKQKGFALKVLAVVIEGYRGLDKNACRNK